jgi:2-(1,2-epoxy-1,2-dihydrophenyl)acetyl-CoA isomerase
VAEVETQRDGGVLTLTLNRPDVLNAFDGAMHAAFKRALEEADHPEVRAVVLTGAGRGFCVGQDLKEFRESTGDIAERLRSTYNPNVRALRGLEKPVIAAVNGPAAGAGLSLACACDVRLAASSASFVPAFVNIGLVPDTGATYFLEQLLGYSRAFEWLCSGRPLSAADAHAWGLVGEVVGDGRLAGRASELAQTLAALPTLPRRHCGVPREARGALLGTLARCHYSDEVHPVRPSLVAMSSDASSAFRASASAS